MHFNKQNECSGKIFFVFFDVLAIIGLWKLMKPQYRSGITKLYAYNPLFVYLTVRGSCESLSMALMYWCFYFIFRHNGNSGLENIFNKSIKIFERNSLSCMLGYILYGLWVHIRIYPIIFLPVLIIN